MESGVGSGCGAIVFIHASDGESWARFLQNKLRTDDYKIQSSLHAPDDENVPNMFEPFRTCAVLVSPFLLDRENADFWKRCVHKFHSRTVVLFLGVDRGDLQQSEVGGPYTDRVLKHRWLEVDGSRDAVTSALVKLIEAYESAELSDSDEEDDGVGEGGDAGKSEKSVGDGKDDTLYDYPPPPRQQNSILRVIPDVLYEQDSHEIFLLLERDAEGTVTMVTDTDCSPVRHIVLQRVAACAYTATLPETFVGKVRFMLVAGEHCLGRGLVVIRSRLEQLQSLLEKEISPFKLFGEALGMSKSGVSDVEEVDTILSRKLALSQLPPSVQSILKNDESSSLGEHENIRWPTLLHFAAEFNLPKVCEELLRYPGMIHAACTENCDGMFPCQLAEKKGYRMLQKKLVQYVSDMKLRRSAADSGISFSENLPPPPRHSSSGPTYVNERPMPGDLMGANDEDYMEMIPAKSSSPAFNKAGLSTCAEDESDVFPAQSLKNPPPCAGKNIDTYAKPRSYSEGCIKTPYAKFPSEDRIEEEENGDQPPPLEPKLGRSNSSACSSRCSTVSTTSSIYLAPPSQSQDKDYECNNNDTEADGNSSCASTLTRGSTAKESGKDLSNWTLDSHSGSRPISNVSSNSSQSQSDYESPINVQTENLDSSTELRKETRRSKSVQDKISHFFKKMKKGSRKQHSSDSDLPAKGHQKIAAMRHSTLSSSSDPSSDRCSSASRTFAGVPMRTHSESERDSGAVCDERSSPVMFRFKDSNSSTPRNSGKRNGLSMQRRQSVRILRAQNDDLSGTPTLPARPPTTRGSKETFVSHIK